MNIYDFQPGQRLKHYKGGIYTILCVGTNSENGEYLVVYKAESNGRIWVTRK